MTLVMDNRATLKDASRQAHKQAEARWIFQGRFADEAAYGNWLGAMADVHVVLGGPAAVHLANATLQAEEDRRIAALAHDLGRGLRPVRSGPQRNASWAWGVAYALNGSAMGASVLLKSGAIAHQWPRAYLACLRGYATSGRLARFFHALDRAPLNPVEAQRGARAVFDHLANRHGFFEGV